MSYAILYIIYLVWGVMNLFLVGLQKKIKWLIRNN